MKGGHFFEIPKSCALCSKTFAPFVSDCAWMDGFYDFLIPLLIPPQKKPSEKTNEWIALQGLPKNLPTIKVPYFTILFYGGWGFPCIGRIYTASSIFRTSWWVTNLTKDSHPPQNGEEIFVQREFLLEGNPPTRKNVHVAKGFYWKTTIIPPKKTIVFLPNLVMKPFIPWFVIKQKKHHSNILPTNLSSLLAASNNL